MTQSPGLMLATGQFEPTCDGLGEFRSIRHSGDCFAYALASETGSHVLYVGHDFAGTDLHRPGCLQTIVTKHGVVCS